MNRMIVIACLWLVGCASANQLYTPDGRRGVVLNCSGWARNWDMCYARAGEICGARGYDIFDKNGEQVPTGNIFAPTVTNREMVIACKP